MPTVLDAKPVVLLADDEPAVRAVMMRVLDALGYDALTAADGAEAVYLLDAYPGEVAAAVLDVQMPVVDGPAALAALRAARPRLPCVFVSGGSEYTADELRARGAAAVLAKPVDVGELGAVLARVIAGAAGP